MVKYALWGSIVALNRHASVTEIPAGAVVEAPATLPRKGTVRVMWDGQPVTVLALDLLDSARIVSGEED